MRIRTRMALATTLAFMLSTAVWADPRNDADAAYGRGDFEAGIALDRASAAGGDVRAMTNLGDAYTLGRGVEKDSGEGMRWYVMALEAGSDLSGPVLGSPRGDSEEASSVAFARTVAFEIKANNDVWYPIVASPGPGDDVYNRVARAAHSMTDSEDARALLTEAVAAGSVQAAASLAHMLDREIVPREPNEALRLYEAAAEKGHVEAMNGLANMYFEAALDENGLRWLRAAVEAGHAEAAARLAGIYEEGRLVPRDTKEAFRYHLIAAERGRAQSQMAVGEAYEDGHGVTRDFAKAAEWYQRAADAPRYVMAGFANYDLALLYLDGRGVPRDPAKAVQLLKLAVADNQAEAMELLGTLELLGVGTPANVQEAMRLYNEAAKYRRTVGTYNLGVVYANGLAGVADAALAEVWFKKAADAGDIHAKARLAGTLDRLIAPSDLLLPSGLRNSFTGANCIRTASARGISPYQGPPDAAFRDPSVRIEGDTVLLSLVVDATDPDGDPLTYRFVSGGTELPATGNSATLRAPRAEYYPVSVFVSDGRGCTMERWDNFEVPATPGPPAPEPTRASDVVLEADPPGTRCARTGSQAEVRADTGLRNRPPTATIEEVSSRVTPDGTVLTLHTTASDPDGDTLVYSYSVLDGSVTDDGAEITWRLGDGGFHMLTAEVTDMHGCTVFTSFTKAE